MHLTCVLLRMVDSNTFNPCVIMYGGLLCWGTKLPVFKEFVGFLVDLEMDSDGNVH